MRKLVSLVGAAVFAISGSAIANDGLYTGAFVNSYEWSDNRAGVGGSDSAVLGSKLGYRSGSLAGELSLFGEVTGQSVFGVEANVIGWISDNKDKWNPYLSLGASHMEFHLTGEETFQVTYGVGAGKMVADQVEMRYGLQGTHNINNDYNDYGLHVGLNYYFDAPEAPAPEPAPVVAKPAPAPTPAPEQAPAETRSITIRLNVLFETNKAEVRSIYGDELEAIAAAMKKNDDIDLVLEGHTDSVGDAGYNKGLSDRRAKAVKAKLVEAYGIPADRITANGYGEERPIASNDTAEGRAQNRRVVGEMSFTEVVE